MDRIDALALAAEEFARRLATVPADAWADPSTCAEWTVGDLVAHVIGGNRMGVALLEGASAQEALAVVLARDPAEDPRRAFAESADAAVASFRAADLDAVVHHPAFDMPAGQLLGFRVTDLVVHGWDLARSTGGDEVVDDRLLAAVWTEIEPAVPMLAVSGVFGEGQSGAIGADAPLQDRVLDACGRRP